jgi:cell wall-associated NlpC family hydrolase
MSLLSLGKKALGIFAFSIMIFGANTNSFGDQIKQIINHYTKTTYKTQDPIRQYIRENVANVGVVRPASYEYRSYGSYSYDKDTGNLMERLKEVAFQYLGIPYRFGGNSRYGLDCSAFTQDVFRQLGINLPRTAREQARLGKLVRHRLKPGDLLFFSTYASYPSHVGIYIGNGKMIEASSVYGRVIVDDVANDPYLTRHFMFAKRILP